MESSLVAIELARKFLVEDVFTFFELHVGVFILAWAMVNEIIRDASFLQAALRRLTCHSFVHGIH